MRVSLLLLCLFLTPAFSQTLEDLQDRVAQLEALVADLAKNQATEVDDSAGNVPNIISLPQYNSIDPQIFSSTITAGGQDNHIGHSSFAYTPGQARRAVISGGYDNINNQLAGTIAGGAHHVLNGNGDHGTIGGGSNHQIESGSYSTIGGGTYNYVEGTNSTIGGGQQNIVTNHYSTISGGMANSAAGYASTVAGGRYNHVEASASYGTVLAGTDSIVSGPFSAAFGNGAHAAAPASLAFTGRYNSVPGDAQAVLFHVSTTTTNATPKHMAATGNWTTPLVPNNTVWAGQAHVVARGVNGQVSAWTLPIVVGKEGGHGWSASATSANTQVLLDQLGLGADAISAQVVNSQGYFRIIVSGPPSVETHWGALVAVTQVQ